MTQNGQPSSNAAALASSFVIPNGTVVMLRAGSFAIRRNASRIMRADRSPASSSIPAASSTDHSICSTSDSALKSIASSTWLYSASATAPSFAGSAYSARDSVRILS